MGYSIVQRGRDRGRGPGGAVRFVRRELGVEAFGINWFELPPDAEGYEHDEAETQQEEVNVIIRGSGVYRIEGEEIPVGVGTFLRFDPGDDARAGRRAGRDDVHRRRRAARKLRAEGAVLNHTIERDRTRAARCCSRRCTRYLDDFGHEEADVLREIKELIEKLPTARRARRVTVRLLLWNLADSKTTLDELRAKLPELPRATAGSPTRLGERFGLISFSGGRRAGRARARADRQGPRGRRGVRARGLASRGTRRPPRSATRRYGPRSRLGLSPRISSASARPTAGDCMKPWPEKPQAA